MGQRFPIPHRPRRRHDAWFTLYYVACITDVYARVIVGCQIASHMRADSILDALEMAAWRRNLIEGCDHRLNPPTTPRSATPTASSTPGF